MIAAIVPAAHLRVPTRPKAISSHYAVSIIGLPCHQHRDRDYRRRISREIALTGAHETDYLFKIAECGRNHADDDHDAAAGRLERPKKRTRYVTQADHAASRTSHPRQHHKRGRHCIIVTPRA